MIQYFVIRNDSKQPKYPPVKTKQSLKRYKKVYQNATTFIQKGRKINKNVRKGRKIDLVTPEKGTGWLGTGIGGTLHYDTSKRYISIPFTVSLLLWVNNTKNQISISNN